MRVFGNLYRMNATDPRVDAYIESCPDWSQAILAKLRKLIFKACPEAEETVKWSRPAYDYKGMICGMSAFKAYVSVGFWKEKLLRENPVVDVSVLDALAKLGDLKEMPGDAAIIALIHEAMLLNNAGVKVPKPPKKEHGPEVVPADLAEGLKKNNIAGEYFAGFSPSARREYISWIEDAKSDATRAKRLATALEWIGEGKQRHWKYQK